VKNLFYSFVTFIFFLLSSGSYAQQNQWPATCRIVYTTYDSNRYNIYIFGNAAFELYTQFYNDGFPVTESESEEDFIYRRSSINLMCTRFKSKATAKSVYTCGVGMDASGNGTTPHKIDDGGVDQFDDACSLHKVKNDSYVWQLEGKLARYSYGQLPWRTPRYNARASQSGKYVMSKWATHIAAHQAREGDANGKVSKYLASIHIERKGLVLTDISD
jgi:hypothetical protein